jgi:ketosteroid isomerase-like protein
LGEETTMTADRCITLRLDPLANDELIAGSLRDQQGNEHLFAGWLGLLTLIEQARLEHVQDTGARQGGRVPRPEEEVRPGAKEVQEEEDDVERFRRSVDAYNRGDLDGMFESWAPDAVVDWSNSRGLDAGVFRGVGEIRAFMERYRELFDEIRIELLDDPVEVEAGLLVAENIGYNRGRDGIEVQARSAWLITMHGGQTTSLTLYQTKQEALEAARKS